MTDSSFGSSADSRGSSVATSGHSEAVTRPSPFVRIAIGPMTRVFNPLLRRAAGRKHVRFAAQIHHSGRRSGRAYVTPASARLAGETFWIPLTFGANSNWARNVLAAGKCTIRWKGADYQAIHPTVVTRSEALNAAKDAFKPPERAMLQLLGITQFLRLELASPSESPDRSDLFGARQGR